MAERIVVVEDQPDVLGLYAGILERAGYEVIMADSGAVAEGIFRTSAVDVVITDLKMPEMGGLEVLRIAKETDPGIVVLLMTGFPSVETAVEAMKAKAADYLTKPFSGEQLVGAVARSLVERRTREEYKLLQSQLQKSFAHGIVGRSRAMLKLFDDIRKAAVVDAKVLILGESGSGKELIAQAIHQNSRRHARPFLPLNCAALPEQLLEAELFGYERGAFTGAQVSREGLLETTDGGTLFLDEVCELSQPLQAKFLRALEEGVVRRLGGRKLIPFDVRFVVATNRDIHEELKKERFREDLFFRLDVIEIRAPALRDRLEDIPLLAAHFLEACSGHYGKNIDGVTLEALDLLTRYDWPGNVRELKNAIERAVVYATGPFITPRDFPEALRKGAHRPCPHSFREWKEKTLERFEKEFLETSLAEHGGNVTRAAKSLGVHRSTLHRLIRKHGLAAD